MNVGQNATLCDSDMPQELVQLLVVPNSKLKMSGNNTSLLVIAGSVACQLENFGGEVFKDGSQIHRSAGTDTLSIVSLTEKTMNTADRESQTGLGRTSNRY